MGSSDHRRYAVALGAVGLAIALSWLLGRDSGVTLLLMIPAVLAASWYGGWKLGVFATVLCGFAAWYRLAWERVESG